ncbi:metalloregulator ArsR/SmtB family transcription factor [Persicobacter psychrovividus]|uniref:Transcriptional regulator n=1 Tax=Persicobacter psychrovividus TaxID=387638 RepID=A0ABN6L4D0_9BACT|nr:transcriptional regulator [Persicobacter psychrovividus]
MGITKTEGFSSEINLMAERLKALGHPARLYIMQYLANCDRCIGNDLVEELPLAQPTISKHLSELKRVGLVQGTIDGKQMNYCINKEGWEAIQQFVVGISIKLDTPKCC